MLDQVVNPEARFSCIAAHIRVSNYTYVTCFCCFILLEPASVGSVQISSVGSYDIVVTWTEPASPNFEHYLLVIDPADVTSPVTIDRYVAVNTCDLLPKCLLFCML